jgi:hypothetical protein
MSALFPTTFTLRRICVLSCVLLTLVVYLVCSYLTNSLYFIKNDRLMKVGMNKRWDGSINIVITLGLDDWGNQVRFLVEIFFSSTWHPD